MLSFDSLVCGQFWCEHTEWYANAPFLFTQVRHVGLVEFSKFDNFRFSPKGKTISPHSSSSPLLAGFFAIQCEVATITEPMV